MRRFGSLKKAAKMPLEKVEGVEVSLAGRVMATVALTGASVGECLRVWETVTNDEEEKKKHAKAAKKAHRSSLKAWETLEDDGMTSLPGAKRTSPLKSTRVKTKPARNHFKKQNL